MESKSAKAKGRKLQQWVRDKLIGKGLKEADVKSTSMGAGGEDVTLSTHAREAFPYSIECKNQERVSIWKAYEQCESNSNGNEPLLIVKRNHHKALAIVDAEHFINRCFYVRL